MRALVPHLQSGADYWMMVVAVLGTTISQYLFCLQAAQEAEQRQRLNAGANADAHLAHAELFAKEHLYRIKLDTTAGMVLSNLIAFCMMLATALTLNQHVLTQIAAARDAAMALRPLAGEFVFTLFALGIAGTGMLAVPVLAASPTYAVADAFNWSAVANGVIAMPIVAAIIWLGCRRDVLGTHTFTFRHRVMGWAATVVRVVAVASMLYAAWAGAWGTICFT